LVKLEIRHITDIQPLPISKGGGWISLFIFIVRANDKTLDNSFGKR